MIEVTLPLWVLGYLGVGLVIGAIVGAQATVERDASIGVVVYLLGVLAWPALLAMSGYWLLEDRVAARAAARRHRRERVMAEIRRAAGIDGTSDSW